ncbi:MAG: hypothetical protein WA880_09690 [Ornithinimicrobium sp.]
MFETDHSHEGNNPADQGRPQEIDAQPGATEYGATAYGATEHNEVPEVIRPTGISWVTVALGLIALAVAGLVLTLQLSDLRVDWSVAVPGFVTAAGAVLVALGGLALIKGRADDEAL